MSSDSLRERALKVLPGGVNSPARAFSAVKTAPLFAERREGAYIFDSLGRRYIDYCLSFGVHILGHTNPKVSDAVRAQLERGISFGLTTAPEIELAELICSVFSSIEQIRFVNSGTESAISAIRLARGYTGKSKVVKFSGGYHGCVDSLLVATGSSATTLSIPNSAGVPQSFAESTILLSYNNMEELSLIKEHDEEIACVIIEPVAGNMGVVPAKREFMKALRKITAEHNILLIFDEIITGFRLCFGGAQHIYEIEPDLTLLGKIIGGGFPIGAFGGPKKIMKHLAPEGDVFSAGTFSGNPIAMSAGIATLKVLREESPYCELDKRTKMLVDELKKFGRVSQIGSMFTLFFTEKDVVDYNSAKCSDTDMYAKFFRYMLKNGIFLPPSQFEACFISTAHSVEDIEKTIDVIRRWR
jgi:glutamate-1-semialdehyde 2,1-aminomutase